MVVKIKLLRNQALHVNQVWRSNEIKPLGVFLHSGFIVCIGTKGMTHVCTQDILHKYLNILYFSYMCQVNASFQVNEKK